MSVLVLQKVHKSFKGLSVLVDVNLAIEEGECHAVIGPNGAGKSTLFNVITGKYRATAGKVLFYDEDITHLSPYKISRKGLARSFQITNVFPKMTVHGNIRNAVLSRKKIRFNQFVRVDDLHEVREETEEIIAMLGLEDASKVPASELSYGQQRALEIGIALATDPKVLLLDEPTAGMTKEQSREAVNLIKRITKGKTVMVVEHDMDVVFNMADRITVLSYGEVLATGTPQEIRENERVKKAYLGKKGHA